MSSTCSDRGGMKVMHRPQYNIHGLNSPHFDSVIERPINGVHKNMASNEQKPTTSHSTKDKSTQHPEDQDQARDAQLLAFDYIQFRLETLEIDWDDCPELPQPNRARLAMREMAESFEKDYGYLLDPLIAKLQLNTSTVYPSFVHISKELFSDKISWARIVMLFALGGKLAVHCAENDLMDRVVNIAQWVQIYVSSELRPWIMENGGWDAFVTFYESQPVNQPMNWRQLLTAGTVGAMVGGGISKIMGLSST